ncbi:Omp28-related outer membrane protein [Flavobacterium sp. XGLA_31]|uniref:Omp28-related outer membrane protein n=1 Tax=Flavobacterium sp. XGLA_31 TaxID=3447666 RepID=UPI003F36AEDC
MTKIKFLLSLVILAVFYSCSDTNVIQNLPEDTETAAPVPGYFKKRVLIEDYTGTWCGNCTRVAYAIDQMYEQSDKVVSIAIHNGNDPYHFANYQPLKDMILPPGVDLELPQSRLNRTIVWTSPEPFNLAQAKALTGNNAGLGLALASTVAEDGTVNLDVNMKFAQNYTGLKLVVYVLENHLIHSQANYTTYFGNINPVPTYEHNHVLRQNITDLLGDAITESTTAGQTVTKSFSFAMPTSVSNPANVSFVAILVNSDNLALNARAADKNEIQEFEQNP